MLMIANHISIVAFKVFYKEGSRRDMRMLPFLLSKGPNLIMDSFRIYKQITQINKIANLPVKKMSEILLKVIDKRGYTSG